MQNSKVVYAAPGTLAAAPTPHTGSVRRRAFLRSAALAVGLLMCCAPRTASAQAVEPPPESQPPAEAAATADAAEKAAGLPAAQHTIGGPNLWETFLQGGILMWPILGCSIVGVAICLERLAALRRGRVIPKGFVARFLGRLEEGKLDRDTALELCRSNNSPISGVFEHAVRKWGRPAVEVEQAIIDGGEREVGRLRRNIRVLNIVATVAPLLGLLGTIIGMIDAFNAVATRHGLGKPELLAHGIAVALLTTAFGLFVAIPALLIYFYFVGRVEGLVQEMDRLSQKVVDQIAAPGPDAEARFDSEPASIGISLGR